MNNIKQIFSKYWLTILLFIGLLSMAIIFIDKEFKNSKNEISDLKGEVSNLKNDKAILESKLNNCITEKNNSMILSNNEEYDTYLKEITRLKDEIYGLNITNKGLSERVYYLNERLDWKY